MRNNQVSIHLERFRDKEQLGVADLALSVYADANNVYEALAAAYFEMLQQLQEQGNIELPTFGRREHYPTHIFSYNQFFDDFLEANNISVDQWRDFKKVSPSLEDSFLDELGLREQYQAYFEKRMRRSD